MGNYVVFAILFQSRNLVQQISSKWNIYYVFLSSFIAPMKIPSKLDALIVLAIIWLLCSTVYWYSL